MTIVVRPAAAEQIRLLRRDVLRPGGTLAPSAYDLMAETVQIGAFDGDVVVGCASIFPEAYEGEPMAWRLRGMAVDPSRQGEGIGRLVLEAAVEAAEQAGAPMLWATGRVAAMEFYQRLGWQAVGDVFSYGPADLPHLLIVRRLSDPRRTVSSGDFPR
jgi:GNAT superfamily N-acetyltransferase